MKPTNWKSAKALVLVRPLVRRLQAYVPGEQPRIQGLIKLNTNENPYPPAPGVLRAVRQAVDGRLRLYPNPTAQALRERLAAFHHCRPDNIMIGNGSDEVLALATRAFVEPEAAGSARSRKARARSTVQFFNPSYSLYPVLAGIHGARSRTVPLRADFGLPSIAELRSGGRWEFDAALTLITTPNAPTGRGYRTAELERLCRAQHGVVVLDETYVDFATENALRLALEYPHVIVSRTFSKAYSLCFPRVGYAVAHPTLIEALDKIKDSYNVNGLAQVAALATLDHLAYYRANFRRILALRKRLSRELTSLGFAVLPTETNFIFTRPPALSAETWLGELRKRKILVRWFNTPETKDYLRITVGTEREVRTLIRAAQAIAKRAGKPRRTVRRRGTVEHETSPRK